ncbi:MAG: hypothetical protein HY363_01800 [Candidatus Aenigmarchaeota archaeon]|nr:hypothetical protein [Candidatus Aenigmarchaeota archaeon]
MKKSQITVFIILSLILLLSAGVVLYFQTTQERALLEIEKPKIAALPAELAPIGQFVQSCAEELAKTAFIQIGAGGGYLDSTGLRYNPFEPTEGNGVQFAPQGSLVLPFWYYLKDKNDCIGTCDFDTKRVPVSRGEGLSIEGQVDDFVSKKLQQCTNKFKKFKEQDFSVEELDAPSVETLVTKEDVFLTIKYPLRITKGEQVYSVNTFAATLPFNFRQTYNLAATLTNLEAEHRFLEKDIRQLIDAFSKKDSKMLPPVSESDIKFGLGTVWVKFDVERKLRQVIASYIPLLQVTGTRNHRYLRAPATVLDKELYETLYNRGMIIPLNETNPKIEVKFNYLDWWKPYFNLNCRGQLCQPDSMSSTFGFIFGIQRYNFAYDVSIPVLVEIRAPEEFKGEGYTFQFMLEANMRNNEAMPSNFAPLTQLSVPKRSMFCDADKLSAGPMNIEVIDGKTKKPVDAVIGYSCGPEACPIGTASNGKLNMMFPPCLGGVLSIEKEDYQPAIIPLNAKYKEQQNISMTLEPYRLMNFKVQKYLLKKGTDWELDTQNPAPQASDEETTILLEKNTTPFEEPFSVFAQIKGSPVSKQEDYSTDIQLIPGKYHVRIYGFKYAKPPIIIPKEKRCVKADPLGRRKCFFIPEKPIVFDDKNPMPTGGAEFDWELTSEMLDSGSTIKFSTIAFGLDILPESRRKIEDLEQLGRIQDYSKEVREELEPKISSSQTRSEIFKES